MFLAMLAFSSLVGTLALTRSPKHTAHAIAPTINVAPVIVAEPGTDTPLPIQVWPMDKLTTQQAWIRINDLPALASLSDGYLVAPGSWRVSLEGLQRLKITAPKEEGTITSGVSIAVMSSSDAVLTEVPSILANTTVSLVGRSQGTAATCEPIVGKAACPSLTAPGAHLAAATASKPFASGQSAGTASKPEDRRRAHKLVRMGDDNMADGNIATARMFYGRAVDMGWSPAAVALAATYDPNELVRRGAIGIVAEPEAARSWYARARELANAEIDFYLQRLGSPKALGVEMP